MLTRRGLTDILENYAQVVEEKDEKSGRKRRTQIWPRTTTSTRRWGRRSGTPTVGSSRAARRPSSQRSGSSPFTPLSFGSKVRYRVAMAKPRVYVETLIPSFYVEGRTALDVVARRVSVRFFMARVPTFV